MSSRVVNSSAWRGYRLDGFPAESWTVEGPVLRALPKAKAVSLQFAQHRQGHLVLQHHGSEVSFRNIRIG
jgi:hypothetical protein